MKYWEESQDEVRKVKPNKYLAKSILKMVKIRLKEVETKNKKEFTSLIVEDYYEIIKESITALMAIDGYKTLSHEVLVGYLKEFFPEFPDSDIFFVDRLRKMRNKIAYKGFFVKHDFLKRNEEKMKKITSKLEKTLEKKLEKKKKK